MEAKGCTLTGLRYGGLSPVDVPGLKFWLKASNGATIFGSSGAVSFWKDLSGNENHLTPINLSTGNPGLRAGRLIQTVNGVGYVNGLTTTDLVCVNPSADNFLYNGSPSTLFLVFRTPADLTLNSPVMLRGYPLTNRSAIATNFFRADGSSNLIQVIKYNTAGAISDARITSAFTNGTVLPNQNVIYCVQDYGYSSGIVNPIKLLYNNVLKGQGAYSGVPDNETVANSLRVTQTIFPLYEVIAYDNTGKTQAQIDIEYNMIVTEYITKTYPLFA